MESSTTGPPRTGARLAGRVRPLIAWLLLALIPALAAAQDGVISGTVRDGSSTALPGVVVTVVAPDAAVQTTTTDAAGQYRLLAVSKGSAQIDFALMGYAHARRDIVVPASGRLPLDVTLPLALSAEVTVTGRSTFTNLADVANPRESLVGIAQSASQGAITARQLETRPIMRAGEVLETVPGVVISQHSGEGKANQYYLRGFNLDHGTDFATTVAGMPVNLPTHAHGHGYSDLTFLMPELVSGVQFSKGPYFAEQGDFATAGAATINYVNRLDQPIVRLTGGSFAFGEAIAAASTRVGRGTVLGALSLQHDDGPWQRAGDFRKVNGVVRYSQGDTVNGFSVTGMAYDGRWFASDQVPARAVTDGTLDRFGTIDPTTGGEASRYSGSFEWQRSGGAAATKVTAYGIGSHLDLFSNFTYALEDDAQGDQFEQVDERVVAGGKVTHRRMGSWAGRAMQHTVGVQVRHDAIGTIGLYRTAARQRTGTVREDAVAQTSGGAFAQNETTWAPWLRTLAGLRVDGYRFDVDAGDARNSGIETAGLVSPRGGAAIGPWNGTELYVNAGTGFHSNDARGATIRVDPTSGEPASRVTPLARARGAEVGVRTVRIPRLQSSLALWTLALDSELVFVGDAGTTEAGRPSRRTGVEWTNYYAPLPWLQLDADVALSRARFTDGDEAGPWVPGAVETVVSAGASVNQWRRMSGSLRWRYFGSRALVEDGSVRSRATSLLNAQAGYRVSRRMRLSVDVFNLLDRRASDIDYFYASRLPGEAAGGVDDIHFHPTLPRSARLSLTVGY